MAIGVTESELITGFVNRSAYSQNSNITPTTCRNILFLYMYIASSYLARFKIGSLSMCGLLFKEGSYSYQFKFIVATPLDTLSQDI